MAVHKQPILVETNHKLRLQNGAVVNFHVFNAGKLKIEKNCRLF
jgi:hypothetical protein